MLLVSAAIKCFSKYTYHSALVEILKILILGKTAEMGTSKDNAWV